MSWFKKWFGVLLAMFGELVVVLGLIGFLILNMIKEFKSAGPGEMFSAGAQVVEHAQEIGEFLENIDTLQLYVYGGIVVGVVIISMGFLLLVLAGRR